MFRVHRDQELPVREVLVYKNGYSAPLPFFYSILLEYRATTHAHFLELIVIPGSCYNSCNETVLMVSSLTSSESYKH